MNHLDRIAEIERRAMAVNMTLHEVCVEAGVAFHQISRWRRGEVSPTVKVVERDLGKLSDFLEVVERRVFAALSQRFIPGGQPAAA